MLKLQTNEKNDVYIFFARRDARKLTCLTAKFQEEAIDTPYNVGSVLWRLFSTLEVVQYIGGLTSVLWGIAPVQWG